MTVESPCIGVCKLDSQSICTGCGRLLAEIAEWSQTSDSRKRAVIALATQRRVMMAAPTPSAR
ncbi:DUF1289 domain-containing protein [Nevskia sp.]|uniref:DUF1289 domain-containing protein n=1 Tax=Nevskia sp. TaxID=1929292 RepID=UPI0025E87D7A|nr:DUF1289 domain-containing protein [Nevskia sp.]